MRRTIAKYNCSTLLYDTPIPLPLAFPTMGDGAAAGRTSALANLVPLASLNNVQPFISTTYIEDNTTMKASVLVCCDVTIAVQIWAKVGSI